MSVRLIKFVEIVPLIGPNPPLLNIGSENKEPEERYRFLVINNELVLGDISTHFVLAVLATNKESELVKGLLGLRDRIVKGETGSWEIKKDITAAGVVGADGRVTSWESIGFRIQTPKKQRRNLEKIIQESLKEFNAQ